MALRILNIFKEEEGTHAQDNQGKICNTFERIVNNMLMVLMGVVVVMGMIELIYEVVETIRTGSFLQEIEKMPEVLSLFLWVLIALELLDSVRTYAREHHLHVETVVSVAVVAVARKVIVLDLHSFESLTVLALAAVIFAVCGGYFLVRRSHRHQAENNIEPHSHN